MAPREDLLEVDKKSQEGNVWIVEFDWKAGTRKVRNVRTGKVWWPNDDKARKKAERLTKKRAMECVADNYIAKEVQGVQKKVRHIASRGRG